MIPKKEAKQTVVNKANFLLSSDTLWGYWLDLIFQMAKKFDFDWIDLALRKNFDAWSITYVKDLINKYEIPIKVIQVSDKVNSKEMNQALDLAREIWADVISINAPAILDIKTYKFINNNLPALRKHNRWIKFCIINPSKSSFFALPIPKYYFTNIVEIIKKYKSMLWLDVANIDEIVLETSLLRKITSFLPYISVVYLSDKTKTGKAHVWLWEWILKIPSLLKKFKQNEYFWYFSLKVEISKRDLSDLDKVEIILKKSRQYFRENYEDLNLR